MRLRWSVEGALVGVTTVNHGHMSEMEMIEPTRIRATWAMEDVLRYTADDPRPISGFNGYGHYHETYVLIDGRWHIEKITLKRLLMLPRPKQAN